MEQKKEIKRQRPALLLIVSFRKIWSISFVSFHFGNFLKITTWSWATQIKLVFLGEALLKADKVFGQNCLSFPPTQSVAPHPELPLDSPLPHMCNKRRHWAHQWQPDPSACIRISGQSKNASGCRRIHILEPIKKIVFYGIRSRTLAENLNVFLLVGAFWWSHPHYWPKVGEERH